MVLLGAFLVLPVDAVIFGVPGASDTSVNELTRLLVWRFKLDRSAPDAR